ncbi:MAG: peptidoglycan-binding protein [bacterium]|nr:peptidoglycan-binding protein [bacterium]
MVVLAVITWMVSMVSRPPTQETTPTPVTTSNESQVFLNAKGYIVATTGTGSRGFESTTFGPATQRALIRFQTANNIIPNQGIFGPVTRAKVSGMR